VCLILHCGWLSLSLFCAPSTPARISASIIDSLPVLSRAVPNARAPICSNPQVHARMEHPGHRVLSAGIQEWSLGRYTGGSLSSDQAEPAQGPAVHAAMAASAASSGKTLRQLAREGGGARPVGVGTTGGAAGTTIGSLQGLHLGQGPSQGGAAVGTSASRTAAGSANLSQRSPGGAGTSSPSSSATQQGRGSSQSPPSGSPGPQQEDDVAVMYEHTDAETERLEKLQRQLEGDG
jgi:hypothetical protein